MSISNDIPNQAHVDIFRLENGSPVQVARVSLDEGRVAVEADEAFAAELRAGIEDPVTREPLVPDDGFAFLAALSSVYKNPYLYATSVISDE